jgi:hypothetical protein
LLAIDSPVQLTPLSSGLASSTYWIETGLVSVDMMLGSWIMCRRTHIVPARGNMVPTTGCGAGAVAIINMVMHQETRP